MPQALEGSQALARAVAMCRPQVVAAYPITPQTHIVEGIARLVADGQFECEMVSVESEHSAASVALGAAVAGSRAYTASASQGILLMAEVLYDIAGLRVPLVMTCANRALSGPLNIWNDQQDSMSMRDSGWIQLYCATNQEAVDTTIQAFRIAERCELPVMVCVDGFTLTHTLEPLEIPAQEQVDSFLPPYRFRHGLDPAEPRSLGTLVGPEHFTEVRHAHHQALLRAQAEIAQADADWGAVSGRQYGGLLEVRGDADSGLGILTLGSVLGTLEDAMDEDPGLPRARFLKLRSFRPFPAQALREACAGLDTLIVLERALSPGAGGIVGPEVQAALAQLPTRPRVHNFAAGLGGRDLSLDLYARLVTAATSEGDPAPFAIIDADPSLLPEEDR
ncbi:Pyruvate:ferredoxin oxidoreductase, alpha subunit [Thioalkalivibrio nitratireducens DSM 14787]|uniref:Pyruvate:ferredoxin oxidoreductase, alpha subunit n=1 Tax=Thioalkalivibrio nitratireducens (strain DSM 14787 / UNIQEM 213 / ALEN2) TaxID=1255043 RepID=L0DX99_THIND|nr:pyruvate:ferredoxin oxidoreductase subunit alpha [Thioalkalivibrio nitratireducens]AGA33673.1 Pyruvate:ferredoxin oxidoreductase, alpha subunit [Thioalkalivibrio nitratireducens DSM 14787]